MLSLFYLVVRALARLLVSGGQRGRDDGSKDLEILVLRHQLRVLQRTSRPTEAPAHRPGPARGGQSSDPARPLGRLRRHPGDPPPVASPAREAEVDVRQDRSPGPAADRCRDP
ncbi:MAG: hypothetical protein WKF78_11200 [Candidatus Limnocylindrales bacterium]